MDSLFQRNTRKTLQLIQEFQERGIPLDGRAQGFFYGRPDPAENFLKPL